MKTLECSDMATPSMSTISNAVLTGMMQCGEHDDREMREMNWEESSTNRSRGTAAEVCSEAHHKGDWRLREELTGQGVEHVAEP